MTGLSRDAVRARLRAAADAILAGAIVATVAATAGCAARARPNTGEPPASPAVPVVHAVTADVATPAKLPPFYPSDDATPVELERALDERKAVLREIEWVTREESVASGETAAGEYLVTYLITPADDYYDLQAAQSNLPAHHTTVLPGSAHVAVVVRDAADGRIVPGLEVRATLRSESDGSQRTAELPYGWHPILNRYGENIVLPAGPFTMSVRIAMPEYARHDSVNGNRFGSDVIARFAHVDVSDDSLAVAAQRFARGDPSHAVSLARLEGEAAESSIAALLRGTHASGSQVRSGDYNVAVFVQRPHGRWEVQNGHLRFAAANNSAEPMAHLDVAIRDLASNRVVPDLIVHATILNQRGKEIGTYTLPFMWHPWINHYGLDVPVPGSGRYTVHVSADAPAFRRYGSGALKKFNRAINVRVRSVRFVSGTA